MGAIIGGAIGYFFNYLRGETKVKAAMVELERERLNRQTELDREQAKRGGPLDEHHLERLKNEAVLSSINVEIARHELADRKAAAIDGIPSFRLHQMQAKKFEKEFELLNAQVELSRNEVSERASAESNGVTNTQLHKLQAAKFEREIAMLDAQVELSRRDLAMRGDQLDFHDTRMEQTKLEIESLKLQIREQKKRLDEFGHGE